jgi:hypothetical protein
MKRALDTVGLGGNVPDPSVASAGHPACRDIGVRRAIAHAWTLKEAPTIDEVRQRAQGWAPGRSCATALFWRSPR